MRRLALLILALVMLLPTLAQAYDVLILQSRRDPAYDEVLKGFRSGLKISERVIVLTDYADVDIARIVREDRPGLVLTMGDAALAAARKLRQTPVIALMSLGIRERQNSLPNITGIDMFVPPERYLKVFREMQKSRVGVIYNPAKSGWYMQRARQAAQQAGIELVVREVQAAKETPNQLASLKGEVDALWMLPDTTAVTRESAEAYFRFSQEQHLPVISFAAAYLGLGAAAVLEIDRTELGRQAGGMAARILEGGDTDGGSFSWPNKTTRKSNPVVIRRLGILFGHLDILNTFASRE
jgi:putative ABC transport system substrate-binding protein